MKFVASQSTTKPTLIEVNANQVYIRQNIKETVDNSGEVEVKLYDFEEAVISIAEFNAYANKNLMTGQEDSANNMLVLMEAFADLYETMSLGM